MTKICPSCGLEKENRGFDNHVLFCKRKKDLEQKTENVKELQPEPEIKTEVEKEQAKLIDVAKEVLQIPKKEQDDEKEDTDEPQPQNKSYVVEIIIGGIIIIAAMLAFFFFYDFGDGKEK